MKRKIAVMLSLVMMTALTACSSETASTGNGSAETKAEENINDADETKNEKTDDAETDNTETKNEETKNEETKSEETEQDDEENYDTGDATLDNVRNQDEIGENEMLVLSFGTSFNDSRRLTIGAIENAL